MLAALTTQLRLEQADRARRAVVDERMRMARELHDVVAHHLSVVSVQVPVSPAPGEAMTIRVLVADDQVLIRAGLAAVLRAAAGDMLFAPTVTRRLIEAYTNRAGPGPSGPPADLECLTARELEVLRRVGIGAANPEIAESLTITAATVKTHLNRAMAKLHLTSRAQAVVLAYETGLVVPNARGAQQF
jgi:DNA-binding CsgD family transcriptional regulator